MATPATGMQQASSPLTFGSFLPTQFQPIHKGEKLEEDENIECNNVREENS